jgi:hypothetical protein
MAYNLFLDDYRQPSRCSYVKKENQKYYFEYLWEVVKNYKEFVSIIEEKGLPDMVSFDHDLADVHYDNKSRKEHFKYYPETGLDCMKWMINYILENNLPPPKVLIHSMNPAGAENMKQLFNNFLKHYQWENLKGSDTPTDR